jgi:hypothetical protein
LKALCDIVNVLGYAWAKRKLEGMAAIVFIRAHNMFAIWFIYAVAVNNFFNVNANECIDGWNILYFMNFTIALIYSVIPALLLFYFAVYLLLSICNRRNPWTWIAIWCYDRVPREDYPEN